MKQTQKSAWYEKIRREFLLTFFDGKHEYQEKEVNGFYLIKQFSAKLLDWEVAIYTKQSYQKKKANKERINKLLIPRGNKQERV